MSKVEGGVAIVIGSALFIYGALGIALGVDALDGTVGANSIPAAEALPGDSSAGAIITQGVIAALFGLSIGLLGVARLRGHIK